MIMVDKKQITEMFRPLAVLEAMTPEALSAVSQGNIINGFIPIRKFPFRIGRESRVRVVDGKIERIERSKLNQIDPNNDLYLVDRGVLLNISREHLQIERHGDSHSIVDRGSASGTKVNLEPVGGDDSGGEISLTDGDEILIGTKASPYRYRFVDLSNLSL
jgi:pSer/pThr/pTyr-binding forkhead associated (FHA) protein